MQQNHDFSRAVENLTFAAPVCGALSLFLGFRVLSEIPQIDLSSFRFFTAVALALLCFTSGIIALWLSAKVWRGKSDVAPTASSPENAGACESLVEKHSDVLSRVQVASTSKINLPGLERMSNLPAGPENDTGLSLIKRIVSSGLAPSDLQKLILTLVDIHNTNTRSAAPPHPTVTPPAPAEPASKAVPNGRLTSSRLKETLAPSGDEEQLYQEALGLLEEEKGAAHPDTLNSLCSLARLREAQGKQREAENLYRRAMQIADQQMGRNHPSTVALRRKLQYIVSELQENDPDI